MKNEKLEKRILEINSIIEGINKNFQNAGVYSREYLTGELFKNQLAIMEKLQIEK